MNSLFLFPGPGKPAGLLVWRVGGGLQGGGVLHQKGGCVSLGGGFRFVEQGIEMVLGSVSHLGGGALEGAEKERNEGSG